MHGGRGGAGVLRRWTGMPQWQRACRASAACCACTCSAHASAGSAHLGAGRRCITWLLGGVTGGSGLWRPGMGPRGRCVKACVGLPPCPGQSRAPVVEQERRRHGARRRGRVSKAVGFLCLPVHASALLETWIPVVMWYGWRARQFAYKQCESHSGNSAE